MSKKKAPDTPDTPATATSKEAEEVLTVLADPPVDPHPFYREYSKLSQSLTGYKVVAFQMSLATQRAIIRHQKQAHHANQPFWSRMKDTLPHLFNLRVETAEVPFGKCRLVVEAETPIS